LDNQLLKSVIAMSLSGAGCGLAGVFIYMMGIPFIGVAIAHASMAGAIWAQALGLDPKIAAFIASLFPAAMSGNNAGRQSASVNINMSVIFSLFTGIAFMGAGILPGGALRASGYLWGSVLLADYHDVAVLAGVFIIISAAVIIFYEQISAVLFNREIAASTGVNDSLVYRGILVMCGAVAAVNLSVIGGLMLYSLVIILKNFLLKSAFAGAISAAAGTIIAFGFNLPVSATVVLSNCAFFGISLLFPGAGD
jgi:ABC-type Mn2+/Zn2+ transport system permease subunit